MNTRVLCRHGLLAAGLFWIVAGSSGAPVREPEKPEPKKVVVGKNITLEVQGDRRRVLVEAVVCLREGQLEHLLTRKEKKEHEAILSADLDGRDLHKALLLAGGKEGSPVKFEPKYQPASGSRIQITLQYEEQGKVVTIPAQQWIRGVKTKKDLTHDWVFAGSRFVPNPLDATKPDYYLANDGDVICVANRASALLDVPVNSPNEVGDGDLDYEAHTERIPKVETKVVVILEVVPEKK